MKPDESQDPADGGKEAAMKVSVRRFARSRVWILVLAILAVDARARAQSVATVGELLAAVVGHSADLRNYFVIPVAGHVSGANETAFRTDVTILAAGSGSQKVAVAWLAQGRRRRFQRCAEDRGHVCPRGRSHLVRGGLCR